MLYGARPMRCCPGLCRRISLPGSCADRIQSRAAFLSRFGFSAVLFAFGQFSLVSLPAFLFIGLLMGVIYYVSESFLLTVSVRLAFNILLFFFEDGAWSLILKRSNFVFFICLCAVLFLLFLTLGLSEAQRIYYTKGTDAAQLPRRDKEENARGRRLSFRPAFAHVFDLHRGVFRGHAFCMR